MLRVEAKLGEMAQLPVSMTRSLRGSHHPTGTPQEYVKSLTAKPVFKRTCCKTCNGDGCVGRCKF